MQAPKSFALSLTIAALLLAADLASAEVSRYEEPIRYRKAAMTMIKRHYTQINSMASGKIPMNREELNRHASYLEMLSRASLDGFVAGSHEGDTRAKPEIWTEWARFRSLNDKFVGDAARVRDAAKSNNADALKTAVNDMTRTCKNCHDDFRATALGQ
jgi:cytochrome c556